MDLSSGWDIPPHQPPGQSDRLASLARPLFFLPFRPSPNLAGKSPPRLAQDRRRPRLPAPLARSPHARPPHSGLGSRETPRSGAGRKGGGGRPAPAGVRLPASRPRSPPSGPLPPPRLAARSGAGPAGRPLPELPSLRLPREPFSFPRSGGGGAAACPSSQRGPPAFPPHSRRGRGRGWEADRPSLRVLRPRLLPRRPLSGSPCAPCAAATPRRWPSAGPLRGPTVAGPALGAA